MEPVCVQRVVRQYLICDARISLYMHSVRFVGVVAEAVVIVIVIVVIRLS